MKRGFTDMLGSIRNMLPFSDAKEGPLSSLSQSGAAFVTTFAGGAQQEMQRDQTGQNFAVKALSWTHDAAAFATGSASSPVPAMAAGGHGGSPAAPNISVSNQIGQLMARIVVELDGRAIYEAMQEIAVSETERQFMTAEGV